MCEHVFIALIVLLSSVMIITEYIGFTNSVRSSIRCTNLSYLSNTIKYDLAEIIDYVLGTSVDLRISFKEGKSLSYYLPLTKPTLVISLELLKSDSASRNILLLHLTHELCHIKRRSSIRVLIHKLILLATLLYLVKVYLNNAVYLLIIISFTYAVLKILNLTDELKTDECVVRYLGHEFTLNIYKNLSSKHSLRVIKEFLKCSVPVELRIKYLRSRRWSLRSFSF